MVDRRDPTVGRLAMEINAHAASNRDIRGYPRKTFDGETYFFGGSFRADAKRKAETMAAVAREYGYRYRIETVTPPKRDIGMPGIFHLWLRMGGRTR